MPYRPNTGSSVNSPTRAQPIRATRQSQRISNKRDTSRPVAPNIDKPSSTAVEQDHGQSELAFPVNQLKGEGSQSTVCPFPSFPSTSKDLKDMLTSSTPSVPKIRFCCTPLTQLVQNLDLLTPYPLVRLINLHRALVDINSCRSITSTLSQFNKRYHRNETQAKAVRTSGASRIIEAITFLHLRPLHSSQRTLSPRSTRATCTLRRT